LDVSKKAATKVAAFLYESQGSNQPPLPPITARTVSSGPKSSAPKVPEADIAA
jgi:hypothetical protein